MAAAGRNLSEKEPAWPVRKDWPSLSLLAPLLKKLGGA